MFFFVAAVILKDAHYVLYYLTPAIQPRMLVTFNEELSPLSVNVRVGQVRERQKIYCHICHLWGLIEDKTFKCPPTTSSVRTLGQLSLLTHTHTHMLRNIAEAISMAFSV